jgi:hypothetical protein
MKAAGEPQALKPLHRQCIQKIMNKLALQIFTLFIFNVLTVSEIPAQQDRDQDSQSEENAYGSKFFDQLRSIFGKFQNADLQKVFQDAQPIQCSELVGRKGEWRPVAFFNEDRKLGDWCRESLEEVKADLTVYTFKGSCSQDKVGTVQVTTEFPTAASLDAYHSRQINLNQVDITVNDPVSASLNPKTMAYTFNLPFLFLKNNGPKKLYSFMAPDRDSVYASDMSSRWECKAVSSTDVTFRFLICRVSLAPQKMRRNETWEPTFGSSAFFILSDGTEAQSSVHMTFGDGANSGDKPEEAAPESKAPPRPVLKRGKPSPGKNY